MLGLGQLRYRFQGFAAVLVNEVGSAGVISVWPKSFPLNNSGSPVCFARA